MTTDPLAELRQLTDHETAASNQAAADAFRPRNRHPVQDWEADVSVKGIEVEEGRRQDGTAWQKRVAVLTLKNLLVHKAITPFLGDTEIKINLPDSSDKARLNSEQGLMVASAASLDPNVHSLADFNGRRISAVEKVKNLGSRKFTRNDGTEGSSSFNLFYYEVISISPASNANGVAAAPSPEAIAMVNQFASGLTQEEFNMSVLRDVPLAASDPAVRTLIISQKYLAAQEKAGVLKKDETGVYHLAES